MTLPSALTVFISYSHKDRRWLDDLRSMLSPLGETGAVQVWWDEKIKPSDEWRREIEEALSSARVAVLLVSRHFLASDFIIEVELRYLLEAAQRQKVKILWLLVSPCLYEHTALREIQALNDVTRPLSSLRGAAREHALKVACQTIAEAVGVHLPASSNTEHPAGKHESSTAASVLSEIPLEPYVPAPRLQGLSGLARDEAVLNAVASARTQAHEAFQGCGRLLGALVTVYCASLFYSLAFFIVAVPISRISWFKTTWTIKRFWDSLGLNCGLTFLGFILLFAAFVHASLIALNEGNLKGAKIFTIDMTVLCVLMSFFAAMTYSNVWEQVPGLLGCLGALLISLFTERWLARWLEQRRGAVLRGSGTKASE